MLQGWSRSCSLAWVASGSASILVQSARLHLDPTCGTALDTFQSLDCPIVEGTFEPILTTHEHDSEPIYNYV